jgi:signal transduction histidine kinase
MAVDNARLHAEMTASRDAAEAAGRAKGEFLAVMSHELRTPLNAIAGYAELMELGIRGPVTQEQREDLARIQRSQRHLLGLINGVLNYSRVDAGAVQYEIREVPVAEALAACEAMVAPQFTLKRLALEFDGCDQRLEVRADPEKLQQVVLNLLTNALKFTEPGGRVTMGCRAGVGTVAITVADTGHGIAADQIERVFDPFVQVNATFTRVDGGIGLGLAISRDLARGMGGDLTVMSVVGEGSTFALTLPRV